jgi:hypothetical protein
MTLDARPMLIVALYLRGEALDPDAVTHAVGVQPTKKQRRGEKQVTSSGREFVPKVGLWALSVELESASLDAHLARLMEHLPQEGGALTSISGVDEAYVDVFIALASESDGEAKGEFEISARALEMAATLGIPVRLTITAGPD